MPTCCESSPGPLADALCFSDQTAPAPSPLLSVLSLTQSSTRYTLPFPPLAQLPFPCPPPTHPPAHIRTYSLLACSDMHWLTDSVINKKYCQWPMPHSLALVSCWRSCYISQCKRQLQIRLPGQGFDRKSKTAKFAGCGQPLDGSDTYKQAWQMLQTRVSPSPGIKLLLPPPPPPRRPYQAASSPLHNPCTGFRAMQNMASRVQIGVRCQDKQKQRDRAVCMMWTWRMLKSRSYRSPKGCLPAVMQWKSSMP